MYRLLNRVHRLESQQSILRQKHQIQEDFAQNHFAMQPDQSPFFEHLLPLDDSRSTVLHWGRVLGCIFYLDKFPFRLVEQKSKPIKPIAVRAIQLSRKNLGLDDRHSPHHLHDF